MNTSDLRGTASHEAGHAIVAWSLGLPVAGIRIHEDDAAGGTDIGSADHLPLIDQIAVLSGGIAAEKVFESPAHALAGACDRAKILDLLKGIPEEQGPAFRDAGYERARALLVAHRSKVVRLAECLLDRRQIDASEFLQIAEHEAFHS